MVIVCAVALLGLASAAIASSGAVELISKSSGGVQGSGYSVYPSVSADGRYVAFTSDANNLVPGDTSSDDVFVRDRLTGSTKRVSVSSSGEQANSYSFDTPPISADGRYIAFQSVASNLVPDDTNGWLDIFRHDRVTGETVRVNIPNAGGQSGYYAEHPSISGDGRFVAFESYASDLVDGDTNGTSDIYVRDMATGETRRVSVSGSGGQGNGESHMPSVSDSGRYVAFNSWASNLVSGDTNNNGDAFVHDLATGETRRVSVSSAGAQSDGWSYTFDGSLSSDGRYVAFKSTAPNLVAGDTNGVWDVFVRDTVTGQTTRVSLSSSGRQVNAGVPEYAISANGRYVAFTTAADNLAPHDENGSYDVFMHDRKTGRTRLVSATPNGRPSNAYVSGLSVDGSGEVVVFASNADSLVPGDTNGKLDVFAWTSR